MDLRVLALGVRLPKMSVRELARDGRFPGHWSLLGYAASFARRLFCAALQIVPGSVSRLPKLCGTACATYSGVSKPNSIALARTS